MALTTARTSRNEGGWARVLGLAVLFGAGALVAWRLGLFDMRDHRDVLRVIQRLSELPWLAPTFIVVYAGLSGLAMPVSPLAFAAGALFGVVRGSIYVELASILGATIGYWLARSAIGGFAQRLLRGKAARLQRLPKQKGFLTILRLQLMPIVPFGLLNLAAGAARVPFVPFLAGTAIGILPGTVAAVYVGDRLIAGVLGAQHRALWTAIGVAAALMLLSFLPTLLEKRHRRR